MDTSETYIKMCEKSVEIQPKIKLAWHNGKKDKPRSDRHWQPGDFYSQNGEADVMDVGADPYYYRPDGVAIWLPRQDQLQEMVKIPIYDSLVVLELRMRRDIGYWGNFISWEQLWLAFVMQDKYGKSWVGEKWIPYKE